MNDMISERPSRLLSFGAICLILAPVLMVLAFVWLSYDLARLKQENDILRLMCVPKRITIQ
jgi:hypothetical protein